MRSRSLLWSFNYAIEGFVYALRTQRNMRLHALAAAVVLAGAMALRVSALELVALLFAITLVLVAELANTALEAVVDLSVDRFDPTAKTAKDVAAAAVLVASVNAVAVGYVVFFDRVTGPTASLYRHAAGIPAHVTVIALAVTGLAVIVGKALTRTGTWLRGGWPSGHTALAVAAAASVGYGTGNSQAAVLAMLIAALVAQSRVEGGAHTIGQVASGALVGFLGATLAFQVFVP